MKRVEIFKYVKDENQSYKMKLVSDTFGEFHQWGCDYEEFEGGPGNYSTAIVQLADDTIKNVPVEMVKFVTYFRREYGLLEKLSNMWNICIR